MKRVALLGARIFDGDDFRDGTAVIIEGERIAALVDERRVPSDVERRLLDGGLLAPGFIDVQVNGGGGYLLNEDPSERGVLGLAAAHRRHGTVGLLPTVITDAPDIIARAVDAVRTTRRNGARAVLGIHMEGPFIDPRRKGAHDEHHIRTLGEADISALAAADCGTLLLTVAPNVVAPRDVRRLADAGIVVSLGHSDAKAEQVAEAIGSGATAITHLFNAMSQLESRAPGMVGAALADPTCYCSLIVDGHHVHDAALKVALAAKSADRLILITDAMPTAAGGPDRFHLQGRLVTVRAGRLELENGTLAGSNLTMDAAVRYCVRKLDVSLADALRMASLNPATALRLADRLGRLAPGHLASLVHLSDELEVLATWVEGE